MFIFQCLAVWGAALQALPLALHRHRRGKQALPPPLYRSEAFAEDLFEPPAPATLARRLAELMVDFGQAALHSSPLPLWQRLG